MKTSNVRSVLRSSLQASLSSREHDPEHQLAAEIMAAWSEGAPVDAAAALAEHAELRANHSVALDLAYEEYCQRSEMGEQPDTATFCARFPSLQASLRRLIDAHQFLEECLPPTNARGAEALAEIGADFLGYTLLDELGRGAFARVFLATEKALGDRLVALKVSWRGTTEAMTLGRLNHENIAPVHSVHKDPISGLSAICMPYKGRATLCNLLDHCFSGANYPASAQTIVECARQGVIPPIADAESSIRPRYRARKESYRDGIVRLVIQIAKGLASAHAKGIFHRDLKPSNVLLTPDGLPLLLDFNLSFDERVNDSQFGGTLAYMSPEQLRATDPHSGVSPDQVDARSDLYSLGVILHELLTGQHPFGPIPGGLRTEQLRSVLRDRQSRELAALNEHVDRTLAAIVRRCLATDPKERFQTGTELATALRRTLSLPARGRRWLFAHSRVAAAVGVFALCAGFATALPMVVRDPPHIVHLKAGIAAFDAHKESAALEELTRAIEASPDQPDALFARGWVYKQQAIQAWIRGEKQSQNLLQAAWADFAKAEERSDNGRIAFCMGVCDTLVSNHPRAIEEYNRAFGRDYAPIESRHNLGFCYLKAGHKDGWARARTLFDEVLANNPQLSVAYFNRACVGRHQLAESRDRTAVSQAMIADMRQAVKFVLPEEAASKFYLDAATIFAQGARIEPAALQDAAVTGQRAIDLGEDASLVRGNLNSLSKTQFFVDLSAKAAAPRPRQYLPIIPVADGLGIRLPSRQ